MAATEPLLPDDRCLSDRKNLRDVMYGVCNSKVLKLEKDASDAGLDYLPLSTTAGPAVRPWGVIIFFTVWVGYFFVPVYMLWMWIDDIPEPCHNITDGNAGQDYPRMKAWGVFGPSLLGLLGLEYVCLGYIALPILQVIGQQRLSFLCFSLENWPRLWVVKGLVQSTIARADFINTGIFLALTTKLYQGGLGDIYNVMSKSVSGQETWISTELEAKVLWWLMYLQAFVGLAWSLPLDSIHNWLPPFAQRHFLRQALKTQFQVNELRWDPEEGCERSFHEVADAWIADDASCCVDRACPDLQDEIIDYWMNNLFYKEMILPNYALSDVAGAKAFARGGDADGKVYQTYMDLISYSSIGKTTFSDHGTSAFALAVSTRMVSISNFMLPYSQKRVADYKQRKKPLELFGVLSRLMRTHIIKLFLQSFLQSGLYLHLQVSLFGMDTLLRRTLSNDRNLPTESLWEEGSLDIDYGMLFSVVIGLANFLSNMWQEFQVVMYVRKELQLKRLQDFHTRDLTMHCFHHTLHSQFRYLLVSYLVVMLAALSLLVNAVAIFRCPSSLSDLAGQCSEYHDTSFLTCP